MSTDQKTIDWYDDNAERYAEHVKDGQNSPYHAHYEKPAIYSLLPDLHGKAVLSMGCGSGEDSSYLKKQGAEKSVGIDISKGLIEIAKKEHLECEFVVGDIEKLPFNDAEFDVVFSSFTLHYLSTYQKAFNEAYRVLKPGGTMVFSAGHPIDTAMEKVVADDTIRDKRLGVVKDQKTNIKTVYGDYLKKSKLEAALEPLNVTFYRQPISDTINQLIEAGFVIEKCIEPKPLPEFEKVDPENYKVLNRIPEIIIFKAKKI